MTEPKYVAATLAWCNARRKERGKRPLKKLPKGLRFDGNTCPCGKAAGIFVHFKHYGPGQDLGLPLPRSVQRFVAAFDKGRLPQYDAEGA